jgi:hypothetical protein
MYTWKDKPLVMVISQALRVNVHLEDKPLAMVISQALRVNVHLEEKPLSNSLMNDY